MSQFHVIFIGFQIFFLIFYQGPSIGRECMRDPNLRLFISVYTQFSVAPNSYCYSNMCNYFWQYYIHSRAHWSVTAERL